MNFLQPRPNTFKGKGCDEDGIPPNRFSAKSRFKSELVLGLDLIHHLVFFQNLNFIEIVRQFKSFTSKYLILEFVHPHDQFVSEWLKEKNFSWYSYDNLKHELLKHFEIIDETNSGNDARSLVFCELKSI